MGWAIDWSRELSTHDPDYYRWTQWLFLRFYERGLAYRKEAPVNWCPDDQTVLANEQVIDGRCERCGAEVEARNLTQWFFRITDYADALLDEMELLESWPERVLTMQRNWIGRSEGARVIFRVDGIRRGAARLHDAARHALRRDVLRAGARAPARPARRGPSTETRCATTFATPPRARPSSARRRRRTASSPAATRSTRSTASEIPIWVADYVLMEYGTGAIMAVPAHDERDHAFAEQLRAADPAGRRARRRRGRGGHAFVAHTEDEVLVNSGEFTGMPRPEAKKAIVEWLAERGEAEATDRLPPARLAALAPALLGRADPDRPLRARAAIVPVPDDQLPVVLPEVEDYLPKGRSPLAAAEDWVHVDVPALRRPGRARDGHDGHLRRLVLVLPPLHRPAATTRSRSRARSPTTGCRSTSTSAASSTRSCTCCTRASSRRCCRTWAWSASASRSRACSTRG